MVTIRDAIADDFRAQIATGALAPGDELPSIHTLRQKWDCSDGPVRLAFALLANEGLITTRQGAAARVNNGPIPPRAEPTTAPPGRSGISPGPRADRVALTIPLGDTGVHVDLGLSRRLTRAEHDQLIALVTALGPIVIRATP